MAAPCWFSLLRTSCPFCSTRLLTIWKTGPVVDYGTSMIRWMRDRRHPALFRGPREVERPSPSYIVDMLPPLARVHRPVDSIPAKHLHESKNKQRHPISVLLWTPDGRRLLQASTSGEFTLWNGMGFNFETIMQVC